MPDPAERGRHLAWLVAGLALVLAACSGAASGPGTPTTAGSPSPADSPSRAAPPEPVVVARDPGGGADPRAQHSSIVEPHLAVHGGTLVVVYQVGRFRDGGAAGIGWATSTDGGRTWTVGRFPGLTRDDGGTAALVTDPAVAHDDAHGWLALVEQRGPADAGLGAMLVFTSPDGLAWDETPAAVRDGDPRDPDKGWITCDNGGASPHRGTCYVAWTETADPGFPVLASRSVDGGATWSTPVPATPGTGGIAVQPAVLADGTIVMPYRTDDRSGTALAAVRSTDGGLTWSATTTITAVRDRHPAGLRLDTYPATTTLGERVALVWADCEPGPGCVRSEIHLATTSDGLTWTAPVRLPLPAVEPGLYQPVVAADDTDPRRVAVLAVQVSGADAEASTLQYVVSSSADGGATWSEAVPFGPAMAARDVVISQDPSGRATDGSARMLGDYLALGVTPEGVVPAVPVALPRPSERTWDQSLVAPSAALPITGGTLEAVAVDPGR
jgi:hypothetical protein